MPKRKCKCCDKYKPRETMAIHNNMAFCDNDCAAEYGFKNRFKGALKVHKEKKKKDKQKKKDLMSRAEWYSKLQSLVNQYVRIRDKHEPCCTCGTTNPNIKYDSGHFIPQKGHDPRRFELTNIHKQCSLNCNQFGSGKRAEYREFIVGKYGEDHLEWLECDVNHKSLKEQFPHWSDIEKEIISYRKKIRELGEKPVT